MVALYWTTLFLAFYSYVVYPAVLRALPARRRDTEPASHDATAVPRISLIITAHNEAARLHEKLDNSLALDYPRDRLEIIVASDASTDQTDAIAQSLADRGVKLARAEERHGKEFAQSVAIARATGDIIVFSDVATIIPPDALRWLATLFSEPEIGAVSSVDRFVSADGQIVGEGAYVRYEMWLRSLESARAGLIGLSGSFFACRRAVCEEWDIQSPSDFNVALSCRRLGLQAVSSPHLVGGYKDLANAKNEYARKVRTAIRGMSGLARHLDALHPRNGLFAFQLWSHKVMRWLAPWFFAALLLVNWAIADRHGFFAVTLAGQWTVYGVALTAHLLPQLRSNTLVRLIYYFVQVNAALMEAAIRFVSGQRVTVWQPSLR